MRVEQRTLIDCSVDITAGDVVADLVVAWCEVPLLVAAEGIRVDTSGNINGLG